MTGSALTIDGVVMPTPSSITPLLTPLWAEGSGRMSDATYDGDIADMKWRFDVAWQPCSDVNAKLIYTTWLSKPFHVVKIWNPWKNELLTFTAYTSEITSPVYNYSIPTIMYESLSLSIVEK